MNKHIVSHAMREDLSYSSQYFPISEFVDYFDTFADRCFPSHWHYEFELQVILKGSAEYRVNGATHIIKEGSAIYIAPEAVHMMTALSKGTVGYNILLSPQFLTTLLQSANCDKYTLPLSAHQPSALAITPDRKEGHVILELMKKIYYTESTHAAYELFLLENVIGIWRNLLSILPKAFLDNKDDSRFLQEQRMKTMLNYIRQNYAQPISISEIAGAANISKSECFRCFSKLSKTTPIEYVNQFRLFEASQLLITTEKSISDICYLTGFNNTSYFSKKFKEQYKLSPKAYRAKYRL